MGFFFQASLERGWKMGREFCIVTGFILTVLGGCVGSCQVQNSESKLKDLYYYRRLFWVQSPRYDSCLTKREQKKHQKYL